VLGFEERKQKAIANVGHIPGVTEDQASKLVAMGINSLEAFDGVTIEDLTSGGFSSEEADDLIKRLGKSGVETPPPPAS